MAVLNYFTIVTGQRIATAVFLPPYYSSIKKPLVQRVMSQKSCAHIAWNATDAVTVTLQKVPLVLMGTSGSPHCCERFYFLLLSLFYICNQRIFLLVKAARRTNDDQKLSYFCSTILTPHPFRCCVVWLYWYTIVSLPVLSMNRRLFKSAK